jgi:FkbM family methyltransferase
MSLRQLVSATLKCVPWSLRTQIRKVPGIAGLQRAIVSRALDGHDFVHCVDAGPASGVRFCVRLPEDKGIWTGTYESAFAVRLGSAVRPGSVTYDIGSWHGFFAGVMAAQGAGEVHVFEPLPANAARIRKLIELNPDKQIVLHTCAIGDRDAPMDLMVMAESSMAKLKASPFQTEVASGECLRVPMRSIDSMLAAGNIAPPALMKIDVEGAELLVLQGACNTLRAHKPEIFAEVHSSALLSQCSSLLQDVGYTLELLDTDRDAARAKGVRLIRAAA